MGDVMRKRDVSMEGQATAKKVTDQMNMTLCGIELG